MLATNFVFIETADTRIRFSSVGVDNNLGNRAFSAAGPRVWNDLPTDLRQPDLSYSRFTQSPKTFFLFGLDKAQCEPTFNSASEIILLSDTSSSSYIDSNVFRRGGGVTADEIKHGLG